MTAIRNTPKSPIPVSQRGAGFLRFGASPAPRRRAVVLPGKKGTAMSKVRIAIVATLLASATSAWADGKYKRSQDVKVDVHLSDRVKPVAPKQQGTSEFKPELNAD